ncbi:MAG: YozE family protein [Thermacetogeniaceae bacterium]
MKTNSGFNNWLKGQATRNDPVGDIARDALQDPCWPETGDLQELNIHLDYHGADDGAYASLRQALREYRQQQPGGETEALRESQLLAEGVHSGKVVAMPSWRTGRSTRI